MRCRSLIFAACLANIWFASVASGQNAVAASSFPSGVYRPITGPGRVTWTIRDTVSPPSLVGGAISAGWGTEFDHPPEYGTHWLGFAKRYGMRLTGIATQNAMEAGLGALWGEDPRYFRDPGAPLGDRVRHVIKFTFFAYNREGELRPAYARYAAIAGSNFLSNTWRADSEADTSNAMVRIGLGLVGRLGHNAAIEFWPDLRTHVFHVRR